MAAEWEDSPYNAAEVAALVGPVVDLPAESVAGVLVAVVGLDGSVRVAGSSTLPRGWGLRVLGAVTDSMIKNGALNRE